MEKDKIKEVKAILKVGQVLMLQTNNEGRDLKIKNRVRKGKIIYKTRDFITVQYKNLGQYKESFNYTDFITGGVILLS